MAPAISGNAEPGPFSLEGVNLKPTALLSPWLMTNRNTADLAVAVAVAVAVAEVEIISLNR
ncbi:MAG: hypothetical protein ACOC0P_01020 [Planctomycetota bacterium]